MTVFMNDAGLAERLQAALSKSGLLEDGDEITLSQILDYFTPAGITEEAMCSIIERLGEPLDDVDLETIRSEVAWAVLATYERHGLMAELAEWTRCEG